MNPKVDWFFEKPGQWQHEFGLLRKIALESGLTEELKWGCPCYTLQGNNIFLIHGFKEYCALLFMKGVLLNNDHKLLIQQTENVQSARQIRFTAFDEIVELEPILKAIIHEAIDVEKSGDKVEFKQKGALEYPEELIQIFAENNGLQTAFEALTQGRQRGYILHFSQAKQSATKTARINKSIKAILEGKGLND